MVTTQENLSTLDLIDKKCGLQYNWNILDWNWNGMGSICNAEEVRSKIQKEKRIIQGVPKKTHYQNAVEATVHWLNYK